MTNQEQKLYNRFLSSMDSLQDAMRSLDKDMIETELDNVTKCGFEYGITTEEIIYALKAKKIRGGDRIKIAVRQEYDRLEKVKEEAHSPA